MNHITSCLGYVQHGVGSVDYNGNPVFAFDVLQHIKNNLTEIIIIMALQPFVGPWPIFQFLDPTHSR
jgi:hypothetical protein